MKKVLCFMLTAGLLFIVSCGSGGNALVSVNGKNITENDLNFLSTLNPRIKAQIATPFGKKQILDNLVEQELLYQAALKKGLQRDSGVKAKMELYRKVVIGQSYIESELKKSAREYYDKHKDEFEKLQLAHIEIKYALADDKQDAKKAHPAKEKISRSKDEALKLANEVKARLDKGEEFATVAKDVSEDSINKNNGGDLGKVSKNEQRLERRGFGPLVEKAFSMQVGETAGPIETKEGYHIITVTKGSELQPYEEAEQVILFKVQGDERNKILASLKKDSKVVYPEAAAPAAAAPTEQAAAPKPEANPAAVEPEKKP
jgi:parvulin-like peptidyl-prolyl isomerase